jgi:hypothetical protein
LAELPGGCKLIAPIVLPLIMITKAAEAGVPVAAVTLRDTRDIPVDEIDGLLVVRVVVVVTQVVVTATDATEVLKPPFDTKPAVMVLLPTLRELPGIVTVAVALFPVEGETAAEAMEFPASVKVNVPEGVVVPLTGVTVAVSWTEAPCDMVATAAVTAVVVATNGVTLDQFITRL